MNYISLEEISSNISSIGWDILKLLNEKELNFIKIKNELCLSQEKTYKELARLEGGLLILSQRDPKDQRTVIFSLSKYGKELFFRGI